MSSNYDGLSTDPSVLLTFMNQYKSFLQANSQYTSLSKLSTSSDLIQNAYNLLESIYELELQEMSRIVENNKSLQYQGGSILYQNADNILSYNQKLPNITNTPATTPPVAPSSAPITSKLLTDLDTQLSNIDNIVNNLNLTVPTITASDVAKGVGSYQSFLQGRRWYIPSNSYTNQEILNLNLSSSDLKTYVLDFITSDINNAFNSVQNFIINDPYDYSGDKLPKSIVCCMWFFSKIIQSIYFLKTKEIQRISALSPNDAGVQYQCGLLLLNDIPSTVSNLSNNYFDNQDTDPVSWYKVYSIEKMSLATMSVCDYYGLSNAYTDIKAQIGYVDNALYNLQSYMYQTKQMVSFYSGSSSPDITPLFGALYNNNGAIISTLPGLFTQLQSLCVAPSAPVAPSSSSPSVYALYRFREAYTSAEQAYMYVKTFVSEYILVSRIDGLYLIMQNHVLDVSTDSAKSTIRSLLNGLLEPLNTLQASANSNTRNDIANVRGYPVAQAEQSQSPLTIVIIASIAVLGAFLLFKIR